MIAEIITIGTEILLGDIVNTNSYFLSKELAGLGISVHKHTSVGDNEKRLLKALGDAWMTSDVIITTGGLGPTTDDMTKEVIGKFLNKDLVLIEDEYNKIKEYFIDNKEALVEGNIKQARFPHDAYILENGFGTAPGCIIEDEGKYIIVLPGPPREMNPMFVNKVVPFFQNLSNEIILSENLRLFGLGEWDIGRKIKDLMEKSNPTIAPYSHINGLTIRITARASSKEVCYKLIEPVKEDLYKRLGKYIYGRDEETLEDLIGEKLIKNRIRISIGESITGGNIVARLLSYGGGMSQVLKESLVTYSNEAKIKYLGVNPDLLDKYGPVSQEVCSDMARGILEKTNSHIGLVTTGLAGPKGDSRNTPIGRVFIGINIKGSIKILNYKFNGTRKDIQRRATNTALFHLLKELESLELFQANVSRETSR